MSSLRVRFLHSRSRPQSGQRSDSCHSYNSETTEANLMKLHRKIKHNEKVCCAQDLGSYTHGQGHSRVRGQICVSAITQKILSKFDETSQTGRIAQSVGHLTHKLEVLGSIPCLAKGSCHWQKYVHEVLVNPLGGLSLPRKNVVRLTDCPDMTIVVYCGRKTTTTT